MKCWRKSLSPEERKRRNKYKSSPKEQARKLIFWRSPAGRASWRRTANKMELRRALKRMGETLEAREETHTLYSKLEKVILSNKEKARKILKGGIPDAIKSLVEFKFGIDHLRADQLIADILIGKKSKIRWLPSWDSLEKTLSGKKNRSVLFRSYLDYVEQCDKIKVLDFNKRVSA